MKSIGVMFWGYEEAGALVGVMPIQQVQDVTLVRHAYVRTSSQRGRSGRARHDPAIGEQILAFLKPYAPRSTVVTDGIIGCPHEEGSDYPEGASCPQCPYWAGRDRFTHERSQ